MLRLGSRVEIYDNSGAIAVKIINLRVKKTYKSSYLSTGSYCLSVVKLDRVNLLNKKRSLKKKDIVEILIVCTKKKSSRKNGIYINFSKNIGIPFEYKNKRYQVLASRVFTPVAKEAKKKKYKYIMLKARKVL